MNETILSLAEFSPSIAPFSSQCELRNLTIFAHLKQTPVCIQLHVSLQITGNRIYKEKLSAVIDNFLQILAIRVSLLLCLSLVVGVAQLGQNKYFKKVAINYVIYA